MFWWDEFSCRGMSINQRRQSSPPQNCLLCYSMLSFDRVGALVGNFSLATPRAFVFVKTKENFIIFEFGFNFFVDYCQLSHLFVG